MRPIVTDVAWSACLCLLDASPTKTDEPIDMLFAAYTRVSPTNHKLSRGPGPPWEGPIFSGGTLPGDVAFRQNSLATCLVLLLARRIIHEHGYTPEECLTYRPVVYSNVTDTEHHLATLGKLFTPIIPLHAIHT